MDHCETVKVKPWGGYQGEYVLINAADFDSKVHTLADAPDPLDHDGDGVRGGSPKGSASTAAKGARRKRKAG